MENKNLLERVSELTDTQKLDLYSVFADKSSYEGVYTMDEFDNVFDGETPYSMALSLFYGDVNPNDEYFTFNGYGNPVSFHSVDDAIESQITWDELLENLEWDDIPYHLQDLLED